MSYARVVLGTINRIIDAVPENLDNISGFNRLTPAELLARGWLPIVDVKPDINLFESYGQPTVVITDTEVTRTFPVVQRSLVWAKQTRRSEFREKLKSYVYENFDLDDIVAMLVMAAVPVALKNRVNAAKAIYDTAIADLNNAATVADVIAINPAWPT